MITLTKKIRKAKDNDSQCSSRVSIRDRLLVKEVQEMEQNLPSTCNIIFPDPNLLYEFFLIVCPDEGAFVHSISTLKKKIRTNSKF